VFAALAAHANQVVSREELVDAVWGADAPATAMNSVYTYVARLRNRLEPSRPHRARSDLLVSDGSGYMLVLPPDHIDKQRFEALLENARHLHNGNAVHSAIGELEAGLALWQGTAYGGAVGPFVESERTRLTELRLAAMEDRAEMLLELDRHPTVVGELFGLVRRHPLRERLRYLLMSCYVGLGRQADALAEYHDLRTALADELGIEPGDQLQRFYEQILRRRQPSRPVPPQTKREPVDVSADGRAVPLAQLARDVPGFTGRTAELSQLHDVVTAAEQVGESAVILLSGGPGVGKTALAVRFAHALSRRFPDGQLHVNLRGFADAAQPMAPIESLGHLLAALGGSSPAPTDLERQCARYRRLVAGRRLLMLLDNAASVEQVRPLLPGASSCVVIVTSRNRLAGLTVRDGARRITLDVMNEEDAVSLFSRVVGRRFDKREYLAVRKLVDACGRLPLALRIAAARINAAPSLERAIAQFTGCDLVDRLDVPGDEHSSLRTVFEWSYRALSDDAAHMFQALGRHSGPDITLPTAAALAGTSPYRARRLLDALVDANLVQEPIQDRFRLNTLVFAYARQLTMAMDGCVA
jgi:DNA-binding SARP family transcriptional activator